MTSPTEDGELIGKDKQSMSDVASENGRAKSTIQGVRHIV
jgi:hypothetical protein